MPPKAVSPLDFSGGQQRLGDKRFSRSLPTSKFLHIPERGWVRGGGLWQ